MPCTPLSFPQKSPRFRIDREDRGNRAALRAREVARLPKGDASRDDSWIERIPAADHLVVHRDSRLTRFSPPRNFPSSFAPLSAVRARDPTLAPVRLARSRSHTASRHGSLPRSRARLFFFPRARRAPYREALDFVRGETTRPAS